MLGKITKTAVEQLKPGEWLWDADHREVVKGFGARRQIDGAFYCLRYRVNGGQHVKSIGRHGSPWTPDTARTEAKRLLGLVAHGIDPLDEKAKAQAAETFGPEVERYLERRKGSIRPRAFVEVERHLRVNAKPLHRLKLTEIDRRTVAVLLAEIETASGPVTRNRVRSSLSAFFNFLIREGLLEVNPISGTATADEGRSRERVLTDAELTQVWHALRDDRFGNIVRLLILTGQRREEIGGLRFSEVDFDRGLIVLSPDRVKNNRQHEVPLSRQAKAILERVVNGASSTSTSSRVNDARIFGGFLGYHARKGWLDQQIALKEHWRLHDLRRTAATMMADKLGVLPHIVEAILNHVSGHRAGVAGIYNRAKYQDEMREALQRWADYIDGLVTTSTVTSFRSSKASVV